MMKPFYSSLIAVALFAACSSGSGPSGSSNPDGNTSPNGDGSNTNPTDGGIVYDLTQAPLPDGSTPEQRTGAHLTTIEGDPAALQTFLMGVPKGGDLHQHLSGAIYAETYLGWAKTANDCIETTTGDYYLAIDDCDYAGDDPIPASTAALYTQVVEAMSMLNFMPSSSENGHDHFFATFDKYGAVSGTAFHGVSLADTLTRAAAENTVYVEPMMVSNSTAEDLGTSLWTSKFGASATMTASNFSAFYADLLADSTWSTAVSAITSDIATAETTAKSTLGCSGSSPAAACAIQTRYQVYISRSGAQPEVFAQMVAAYEAAKTEPRLVAVNLVGPEDGTTALENYDLQMSMLQWLGTQYAGGKSPLRLALHAGELAAAYMPSGYTISTIDHVQKAVEIAGANRIGHGVDILNESAGTTVMTEMATKQILVEVCLSSNIQILEISGTAHPLTKYLAAGVPVALSTDDEGVSRSSLTGEYTRAVTDQKLSYVQLKQISRDSLEYSFLPGASLYSDFASLTINAACSDSTDTTTTTTPTSACQTYLTANARAQAEWELERRYRVFEAQF